MRTTEASKARASKHYNQNLRYGRNSVVIMSGWQESQEALQDQETTSSRSKPSPTLQGVMKTEEVRVHHERLSIMGGESGDENSVELKPLSQVHHHHRRDERRSNDDSNASF